MSKTFEQALEFAKNHGSDLNIYESPFASDNGYVCVFPEYAGDYENRGFRLQATVRYEQKVEIL